MRFQTNRITLNNRGSALLNAIVVAGIVAAISGVIMNQTKVTDEASRAPRIRSAMAVMQGRVQALASQFTSYKCQSSNNVGSCDADQNIYAQLQANITGAQCPGSNSKCGIAVKNPKFNPAQMLFTADIVYEGTEVPIAPIKIQYRVPTEVLAQQDSFMCPLATPIFKGYNADGSINCVGFPDCSGGALQLSNQGTFVTSLDVNTLTPQCNTLGASLACLNTQYMSNYSWIGTGFTTSCQNRIDPFVAMGYAATSTTQVAAIITKITSPTTTSTTTSSTTTTLSSCASAADPFTYGAFTACSSSAPPGNPTCVSGTGQPLHGTNYGGTTVSLSMHVLWHGIDSTCNYSSFLPNGGSTGGVGGGCSPSIPGVIPQTVDFFNTSPGPGPGGTNILGPGPGYDPTCSGSPPPPVTTTTTLPLTTWNCYDGYAGGPSECNTGMNIIDDGGLSPNNPGSARVQLTVNIPNGAPNQKCTCLSGTLTIVSKNCAANEAFYTCAGGANPPPSCPYPGPSPAPNCFPISGGWDCPAFQNLAPSSYSCP
jgi:hypothetical protein